MGDGQAERYNRTLINMLKTIPEQSKKNWKDLLPQLCFAYNATINKSTGYSPFYLMFGREPRLPVDEIFPNFRENSETENHEAFVVKWKTRMRDAYSIANQVACRSRSYNKKRYDGKIHGVQIFVGDRVLVRNVKNTGKLDCYWERNVYEVVNKVAELPVYEVRKLDSKGDVDRKSKIRKLHRNLLKKVNDLVLPVTEEKPKNTPRKLERKSDSESDSSSSESEVDVIVEEIEPGHHSSQHNETEAVREEIEGEIFRRARRIGGLEDIVEETEPESEDIEEEIEDVREDIEEEDASNSSEQDETVRRSKRIRKSKQTFTYDVIGGNPITR